MIILCGHSRVKCIRNRIGYDCNKPQDDDRKQRSVWRCPCECDRGVYACQGVDCGRNIGGDSVVPDGRCCIHHSPSVFECELLIKVSNGQSTVQRTAKYTQVNTERIQWEEEWKGREKMMAADDRTQAKTATV